MNPSRSPGPQSRLFHKINFLSPRVGRGKVRGEISKFSPGLPISRSGQFTIEADLPKPPRINPFKIGDRIGKLLGSISATILG
jgi:hypothetical protein